MLNKLTFIASLVYNDRLNRAINTRKDYMSKIVKSKLKQRFSAAFNNEDRANKAILTIEFNHDKMLKSLKDSGNNLDATALKVLINLKDNAIKAELAKY